MPIASDPLAIPATELDGPLRVLAGPGTGKTHALVGLYADLVGRGLAGRERILVLTFSTSAAEEIGRRVDRLLHDSYSEAWISTFHSFCARLLREHQPDPSRLLLNGFQEWVAMRRTMESESLDLGPLEAVRGSHAFAEDLLGFVALLKQNLVHPASFALLAETAGNERMRSLAAVYAAYQARLAAARTVDFRDLIAGAITLLDSRPALLAALRERFRYVLVDEFQDVDPAQFELLRMLAPPDARPRLAVFGDPDQSIYGFRGTQPRLLSVDFPRAYSARTLKLEECRRCPPEVLEAAGRLLRATQPGGAASTPTSVLPAGGSVTVVREANAVDEAFFVAREIRRLHLEAAGELPLNGFAILLRSTTSLSAPFEEALRALRLPYEVRGLGAMARNEVVRFLLAYMAALARPDDDQALALVLGSALSGVEQATVSRLAAYGRAAGRPLARVFRHLMYKLAERDPERFPLPWGAAAPEAGEGLLPEPLQLLRDDELSALHATAAAFYRLRGRARRLPIAALAYAVLLEGGTLRRLLEMELAEADRKEALADLSAALASFGDLEEVWKRLEGKPPLLDDVGGRLDALISRAVDENAPSPGTREAVQVLTVHQAKGLEFEVVFCPGLAHGVFPLAARPHPLLDEEARTWMERNLDGFRPPWPSGDAAHLEEEARLAYVAMTRPRRHLYLLHADEYDQPAGPSPFLELAVPDARPLEYSRSAAAIAPAGILDISEAETLLASVAESLSPADLELARAAGCDIEFIRDPRAGRPFRPYEGPRPAPVDPHHFSATDINSYVKCPRLYWYNHHPAIAPPPAGPEMERGRFLHQVLDDFHQREAEWRHLPAESQRHWLEEALVVHLESYLGHMEAVLDRKREEMEVRRILENYIRFATSMQRIRRLGTLGTEKRFVLHLEGAEIHGKIDRINDTGEGTCEVVDYKTGRGKTAKPAYAEYFGPDMSDVQLGLYYLACREGVDDEGNRFDLNPRYLSLWYPKEFVFGSIRQVLFSLGAPAGGSEWVERPIGDEELNRSREVVLKAIESIRAGDFRPQPRPVVGTCLHHSGCPQASICPYAGAPAE